MATTWPWTSYGAPSEMVGGIAMLEGAQWGGIAAIATLAAVLTSGVLHCGDEDRDTLAGAMRRARSVGVLHADRLDLWSVHEGRTWRTTFERKTWSLSVERRTGFANLKLSSRGVDHVLDDVPWTPALQHALLPWDIGRPGGTPRKDAASRPA